MGEKKQILCYGDSNTYGYDPRSAMGDRYLKTVRWTGILAEKTGADVRNHGVNGRCIPHTSSQLRFACEQMKTWGAEAEAKGKSVSPAQMWIMLGTNDLLQEDTFKAEQVADRMEKFLEMLLALPAVSDEKIKLFLIAPPRMEYGAWVDEERVYRESRRLGDAYQRVAKRWNLPFADAGKWEIPVVFDGVHFSEQGHKSFAGHLLELGWI